MMNPTGTGSLCCAGTLTVDAAPATMRQNLGGKRERLLAQLKQIDEAIAALDANPGVERVLDLVQRASWN